MVNEKCLSYGMAFAGCGTSHNESRRWRCAGEQRTTCGLESLASARTCRSYPRRLTAFQSFSCNATASRTQTANERNLHEFDQSVRLGRHEFASSTFESRTAPVESAIANKLTCRTNSCMDSSVANASAVTQAVTQWPNATVAAAQAAPAAGGSDFTVRGCDAWVLAVCLHHSANRAETLKRDVEQHVGSDTGIECSHCP